MAKTISLCEMYSFSTSPNLCQRTIPCSTQKFQIVMKLLLITLQLLVCSKLSNNLIMPYQSEVFWIYRRQVFRSDKLSPAEHSWCCIHIRRNYRVILLIERPGTGVRTRIREQNRRFLRPYPQTSYHRQCPTHRGSRPPDVLYQTLRFQPTSLAQQNIVSFSALLETCSPVFRIYVFWLFSTDTDLRGLKQLYTDTGFLCITLTPVKPICIARAFTMEFRASIRI